MSDLDADLYGDLYGDDNEFAVPTEPAKDDSSKHEEASGDSSPPPVASIPVVTQAVPPSPSKTASPPAKVAPQLEPIKSPTVLDNTPQPIQAYNSTNQDYSQRNVSYGAIQNDSYQQMDSSLPIVDRHVRPSEMKEEGKMFIGGLNWDTTDEGLRKYFEQFGKVEACTIMRDATGRSRCFAFLTFEEPASVNAVMVREHYLDGKIIDPKRAIPRQEHQRAQKLFIGGLAATVTSESMREFFSQYGKVIDSTVMLDRETGRSKGFGFVSFENADVEPILGFGKLEIDGKLIDVKLAQPRHQREGGEGGFTGTGTGAVTKQNFGEQSRGGGNFNAGGGNAVGGGGQSQGNTPFDPQALAALYTRMFQQFGGAAGMGGMGGMNMGGMGGMGMMGGGMNNGGGFGGAPNMGRMGGGGMGGGMGSSGMGMGMQMNRNGMGAGSQGGMMGGPVNAPRGPRGAPTGPHGGVGPQRSNQRGHGYHPYSR